MHKVQTQYGDFAGLVEIDISDGSLSGNHLRSLLIGENKIDPEDTISGFGLSLRRHYMVDGVDEKFISLRFTTDSNKSGSLELTIRDFLLLVERLDFAVTKNFTLGNPNIRFGRDQKN